VPLLKTDTQRLAELRKELEDDPDAAIWYREDVELLLRRGDEALTALEQLRAAGREFLSASEAASKPMRSADLKGASERWARAGARLRSLIGGAALVGARN
jgi:hypothetical protein